MRPVSCCYNAFHLRFSRVMSVIRFEGFELDEQTLVLRNHGTPIRIQQQPARVLAFLLNQHGALVTREQIRVAIWGRDTFVDFEQGLNFCIRQIRVALNDQAENPRYIETLPRLGYRCIAQIEKSGDREIRLTEKRIRIAVIPIEDLSGEPENYFAAGLTEDMISAISRVDPDRLRVIAGLKLENSDASTDRFDQLQRQLDLDYLLRGSVRRSAGKVRITAHLHDLRDKSVLWSDAYERISADLLAVQEEVTRHVSRSLALELFPAATVGARRYSRSSAAYDVYLKGRFFWHQMTAESIRQSMTYFNEALLLDPTFAPAHAGLADCYAQMGTIRVAQMKPSEALAKAHAHLHRALDLDQTLAEAHCTLGMLKIWYEQDWSGAEREFQMARRLDPSQITALIWQSVYYTVMGRHREALEAARHAREIEPLSAVVNLYLGAIQTLAGQYDLGLRQIQQTIELYPNYYRAHLILGVTLCELDRYDEAITNLQQAQVLAQDDLETLAYMGVALAGKGDRQSALDIAERLRMTEDRTEPALLLALIYAKLGLATEMYDCFEQAITRKSSPAYFVIITAEFRPYYSEPRFRNFLASIGLLHRVPA